MFLVRYGALLSITGTIAIKQQVFRCQYYAKYCHGLSLTQQCSRKFPTCKLFHTSNLIKSPKNYYRILEVSTNATPSEIKKAYFKLAKKYHPDTNRNDRMASQKFQDISEAYNVLGNENKRKQYDMYGSSSHQSYQSGPHSHQDFSQWQNADVKYTFRSNISQREAEEMFKRIMSEFKNMQGFVQTPSSRAKQTITGRIGGFVFEEAMNSIFKKILKEPGKNDSEFMEAIRKDFTNSKKWKK